MQVGWGEKDSGPGLVVGGGGVGPQVLAAVGVGFCPGHGRGDGQEMALLLLLTA